MRYETKVNLTEEGELNFVFFAGNYLGWIFSFGKANDEAIASVSAG